LPWSDDYSGAGIDIVVHNIMGHFYLAPKAITCSCAIDEFRGVAGITEREKLLFCRLCLVNRRSEAAIIVVQARQVHVFVEFRLQGGMDQPFKSRLLQSASSLFFCPVGAFEWRPQIVV
jgi:hypothetical protein